MFYVFVLQKLFQFILFFQTVALADQTSIYSIHTHINANTYSKFALTKTHLVIVSLKVDL